MCNVLIVTGNLELKKTLKDILHTYFANVFLLPHGNSGTEALSIADVTNPEIVILDLNITEKNPFAYQQKLLALHPNLRTILIDTSPNCQHAQRAIRSGAIDYLVQPLIEDEVLNCIHRAIISLNQVSLLNHHDGKATPTNNEMLLPLIQYIHQHYEQQLTLDHISDFMHLNKNYLSQLFKKEVGLTFVAYLTQYRIEQAKLRLRTTHDSLADIAQQVGYNDPAYFSRIFKKVTDLSPNQYRQTYTGDFIPAQVF